MKRAKATKAKRKTDLDVLTSAEVGEVLRLISRRSPTGIRNAALLAVLYGGGLRCAEALALKTKDLDLGERPQIRVQHGKGGKMRTVALLPEFVPVLERWLDKRRELGVNGVRPVFVTITEGKVRSIAKAKGGTVSVETEPGRPLSDRYVREWFTRLKKRAAAKGIADGKAIHAHGMRHAHALALHRNLKWDVVAIQQQLGHEDLSTTATYLAKLSAGKLAEAMEGVNLGVVSGAKDVQVDDAGPLKGSVDEIVRQALENPVLLGHLKRAFLEQMANVQIVREKPQRKPAKRRVRSVAKR